MARIGWTDEEDYPGQFDLWQANCQRSLEGKKGQEALRELRAALLALPDKRLIAKELQDEDGEVCGIGALAKFRGVITDELCAEGEYDMESVGVKLGMPRLVAWKVVEQNDIMIDGRYDYSGGRGRFIPVTPEERYEQMLAWVDSQILPRHPLGRD